MRLALLLLCLVAASLAAPSLALAGPDAVTWCGSDEVTRNRVPDLDVAAAQQIRFVYAVPSDAPDDFAASASGIATDAARIDQWWQAQDPTRAPRFDRYAFPGCTSRFGALDIGFVRLPNTSAYYLKSGTPSLRLDGDLVRVFPPEQKTIVYFDGPVTNTSVCGETDYLADTEGGDDGIAYVYLQSGCELTPPGSGGSAVVAAHELLHNLGAVPPLAPNECHNSPAHACDSASDVMSRYIANGTTLDAVTLDVNHDDYYGHASPWWDVQDSAWLTHLPQRPFSAAVSGSGSLVAGAGTTQLPCDAGCAGILLDDGETVSLSAVPKPGWRFEAWSGACSGASRSCTFAIGAGAAATATFVRAALKVRVRVAGAGRVTSSPRGIACPGACGTTFGGAPVRLVARPAAGWRFSGWSGACTGTRACALTGAGAVRARFERR